MAGAEGRRSGFCGAGLEWRTCGWCGARYGMINVMDQVVFLGLYIGHARVFMRAAERSEARRPHFGRSKPPGARGVWGGASF